MNIIVSASEMPATTVLDDPDNFRAFQVTVTVPEHVYVPVDVLLALAGERAQDASWRSDFDAMLAYADGHGWLRDGAVRAHVEVDAASPTPPSADRAEGS
jgi:hypothetical protein